MDGNAYEVVFLKKLKNFKKFVKNTCIYLKNGVI